MSIDTANLLWLAVVSLAAAASLLLLLTVVAAAATWRVGVASLMAPAETRGCCSGAAALLPGWVLQTQSLGRIEAWRRVAAREHAAAAHRSSETVVADM